jgi:DNA-directed RNA polymerase specialized sigma24 family protein
MHGTTIWTQPDQMLIESVAGGDRKALEQLFAGAASASPLRPTQTGNAALSEDIVSEVFLEVWWRPGRFEGKAQVSTWMFAIARNKALQALRSRWQKAVRRGGSRGGGGQRRRSGSGSPRKEP